MNRKKKIITGIILLVMIIGGAILSYVGPMLTMHPIETGNIEDTDIIAVKNKINDLFFMEIEDGYMVIDAGSDPDKVIKELKTLSIKPSEVKYVFLTHTDYDHVASLDLFTNAQIMLGADERQMIDGTVKRNFFSSNTLPKGIQTENLTWVSSDEKLDIGGHTIECISTPGHTKGSMLYLVDDQYLFTGDAFKMDGDKMSVHPYSMDQAVAKATIDGLDELLSRCEWVFTAHYGYARTNK